MSRYLLLTTTVVAGLLILAAPANAQTASSQRDCAPGPALFATDALGLPLLAAALEGQDRSIDGPSAQATCTADCWDGSTVTCWGNSCSATDSSCSVGERGSCSGTSTGTRYCPECPCTATTQCPDGSTVSCSSSSGDCFVFDNCYVYCDGVHYDCPNLEFECPKLSG